MKNYDSNKEQEFFKLFGNKFKGSVLDIGCNEGIIGSKIKCGSYIGLDIDSEAIKIARDKGLNVYQIDLNQAGLPYAETILCLDVIEHLINPKEFVKLLQAKRVIVSLPNDYTLLNFLRMFFLNKPIVYECGLFSLGGHLHHPTIKNWKRLFEDKFEIVGCYYSNPNIFKKLCPRLFAHTIFLDLRSKK